jgi:dephospho-CoA kinase
MPRLVALVGLPGAGKSVVTEQFVRRNFQRIYFGDLTFDRLKEEGLAISEENERKMREKLREEHGIAAYAVLNVPKITELLKKGDVVVESMYSWEEYLVLKEKFPLLEVVAVYAPPSLRYERLSNRPHRPLKKSEVQSREASQIEKLHQAGPIAMADWTFLNVGDTNELIQAVEEYLDVTTQSRSN